MSKTSIELPFSPEDIQKGLVPSTQTTFVLYFLHGGNHHVRQKNFNFSGKKEEAIARGKAHCEIMGYRFIRVEPFFSNLESDERFRIE